MPVAKEGSVRRRKSGSGHSYTRYNGWKQAEPLKTDSCSHYERERTGLRWRNILSLRLYLLSWKPRRRNTRLEDGLYSTSSFGRCTPPIPLKSPSPIALILFFSSQQEGSVLTYRSPHPQRHCALMPDLFTWENEKESSC